MRLHHIRLVVVCYLLATIAVLSVPVPANAVMQLVQTRAGSSTSGTSLTVTFSSVATAGSLLVSVCALHENATVTGPNGFTAAINQAGTPSQGIFYKVAAGGEASLTCSGGSSSARRGMHIYEYRGVDTANPVHLTASAAGSGGSASTGSVVTTNADVFMVGGLVSASSPLTGSWSNSFTGRHNFSVVGGLLAESGFGGADRAVSATGTYSTSLSAELLSSWRGQIVAFNLVSPSLSVDIVNSSGSSIASPSVTMQGITTGFLCQSVTGTLGASSQKIRIHNFTSTPSWTLTLAPTSGSTARWTAGTQSYDFNDSSGTPAGCADGTDADTVAGRLTVNPSSGTLAPSSGCTTTGLALGASTAYNEGSVNSITLTTANTSAPYNCHWDLTAIGLGQVIPPEQRAGSYALNMTLTLAAS